MSCLRVKGTLRGDLGGAVQCDPFLGVGVVSSPCHPWTVPVPLRGDPRTTPTPPTHSQVPRKDVLFPDVYLFPRHSCGPCLISEFQPRSIRLSFLSPSLCPRIHVRHPGVQYGKSSRLITLPPSARVSTSPLVRVSPPTNGRRPGFWVDLKVLCAEE